MKLIYVLTCFFSWSLFPLNSFAEQKDPPPDRSHDHNYPADGPFYHANFAPTAQRKPHHLPNGLLKMRFVSYNIDFSHHVPEIIQDLQSLALLKNADFILLQEAVGDRDGKSNTVETIARTLKMNYVFAPGCVLFGQDYGNAILSRWPIGNFRKVLLPLSDADNQRIALGATAVIQGKKIQVYSLHLTVKFNDTTSGDGSRAVQVKAAIDQMNEHASLPTFFSGDFNNVNPFGWNKVKRTVAEANFTPVPDKGWTYKTHHFTLDHAFIRGLETIENGIAYDAAGSDHVPIWSVLSLNE